MKKLACTALAAAAVALALSANAMARTWVVDAPNPDIECQNADFPTIQAAVAAAAPGDQVRVCPGVYRERVVVNKPDIDIYGTGPDAENRADIDPTKETIFNQRVTDFDLEAPDITVAGFTFLRAARGVFVNTPSVNDVIRQNYFLTNGEAIRLNPGSSGTTTIEQNFFRGNLTALLSQAKTSNLEVQTNRFLENSIAARLSFLQSSEIRNNDFQGDRAGLLVQNRMGQTLIDSNVFSDFEGRPIDVVRPIGSEISHNEIGEGPFDGIRIRIGESVNVHDNHVHDRVAGNGITLDVATSNALLQANHLFANGLSGILVQSSSGNRLLSNQSEDNVQDGISVGSTSGGNTIQGNLADNNLGFDCRDDSAGPGSGGTANYWINDLGDTANRAGICKPTGVPADTAAAEATASVQAKWVAPGDCLDPGIFDDEAAVQAYWDGVLDAGADPPWICDAQPGPDLGP